MLSQASLISCQEHYPQLAPGCIVLAGARLIGQVSAGSACSFWYNVVVRGDWNPIRLGERCNIQDLACLHVSSRWGLELGDDVSIGHGAVLHGCRLGNRILVGIRAVILDDVEIADDCIIAPGALLTSGTRIPAGSLVMGMPAKIERTLRNDEFEYLKALAKRYFENACTHSLNKGGCDSRPEDKPEYSGQLR